MQFHLISIFPQYFEVLRLSLLGRAAQAGALQWQATDLREYAQGAYKGVDDSPYGGGPGALMRADIWGSAIDAALAQPLSPQENLAYLAQNDDSCEGGSGGLREGAGVEQSREADFEARTVLAIPTPSGIPLTQAKVRQLSEADRIIVACGRYEGIDSRVAQHYRQNPDLEVFEYSLGDYVLNGGEVAALALVEAVGRLLDGVVGNPDSLVQESHEGAGLLEYPGYTRPLQWRGLEVPQVLQGGNHADIEAWREMQALAATIERRPDKLSQLDATQLSKEQRERLARSGWVYRPVSPEGVLQALPVVIRPPRRGESVALSGLGSDTFPMACPDYVTTEQIADFTAEEFDPVKMQARLDDPEHHRYLVVEVNGQLVGYTYTILGVDAKAAQDAGITPGDAYLSKCYVQSEFHGTGLAGALLQETMVDMALRDIAAVSLGTSIYNKRAQKFYKKHGFQKVGSRVFTVGGQKNQDVVMRRVFGE